MVSGCVFDICVLYCCTVLCCVVLCMTDGGKLRLDLLSFFFPPAGYMAICVRSAGSFALKSAALHLYRCRTLLDALVSLAITPQGEYASDLHHSYCT